MENQPLLVSDLGVAHSKPSSSTSKSSRLTKMPRNKRTASVVALSKIHRLNDDSDDEDMKNPRVGDDETVVPRFSGGSATIATTTSRFEIPPIRFVTSVSSTDESKETHHGKDSSPLFDLSSDWEEEPSRLATVAETDSDSDTFDGYFEDDDIRQLPPPSSGWASARNTSVEAEALFLDSQGAALLVTPRDAKGTEITNVELECWIIGPSGLVCAVEICSTHGNTQRFQFTAEKAVPGRTNETLVEVRQKSGDGKFVALVQARFNFSCLYDHQVAHVIRIESILARFVAYLDTSVMGAGKTITTLTVAKRRHGRPICVIAPSSLVAKWHHDAAKLGLTLDYALSYDGLRTAKCPLLTPRLNSKDYVDKKGLPKKKVWTTFSPTDTLRDLIARGALFVFDEVHRVKNDGSQTSDAAVTIAKEISLAQVGPTGLGSGFTQSRIACLSATPGEQPKHILNLLRIMGVLTAEGPMVSYDRSSSALRQEGVYHIGNGLKQIVKAASFDLQWSIGGLGHELFHPVSRVEINWLFRCHSVEQIRATGAPIGMLPREILELIAQKLAGESMAKSITGRLADQRTLSTICNRDSKAPAAGLVFEIWSSVLRIVMASSMPAPGVPCELVARNGFFHMPQKDQEDLEQVVVRLQEEAKEAALSGKTATPAVFAALSMIEATKRPTLIRLARQQLENHPRCKVIVFCELRESMAELEAGLKDFDPLILHGGIAVPKRDPVVAAFQEANTRHRLLIASSRVASVGIDLDDHDGRFPRISFVVPSFFFANQVQCVGRTHRTTSRSDAVVLFVYSQSRKASQEAAILDSFVRKSLVASAILHDPSQAKFPGDFMRYYEVEGELITKQHVLCNSKEKGFSPPEKRAADSEAPEDAPEVKRQRTSGEDQELGSAATFPTFTTTSIDESSPFLSQLTQIRAAQAERFASHLAAMSTPNTVGHD